MLRWLHRDRPTGEANPFEVYLLVACVLVGFLIFGAEARPQSITSLLPPLLRIVWAIMLCVGGALALIGLYWPGDPFTGVEIKRIGLYSVGIGALAWGTAAAFYGPIGRPTAISNIAFALACATRLVQISRRIRFAREHLQAVLRTPPPAEQDPVSPPSPPPGIVSVTPPAIILITPPGESDHGVDC